MPMKLMHRNPARRNRRIGQTQVGRVQNGRAVERWNRIFTDDIWTKLSEANSGCIVMKENPSGGFLHPCTGEEYLSVLEELPDAVAEPVRAIVLRRLPKLDERKGITARKRYFCVILNSFPKSLEMSWSATNKSIKKRCRH